MVFSYGVGMLKRIRNIDIIEGEVWKTIKGFDDYKFSSLGRIISKERVRPPAYDKCGYVRMGFAVNGKSRSYLVHRLIMEAFIGKSDLQVNHKNGIKDDNRIENLEYLTAKENMRHAFRTGLMGTSGELNYQAKLTNVQALDVHARLKRGERSCDIADMYNVTRTIISSIKRGITYKIQDIT